MTTETQAIKEKDKLEFIKIKTLFIKEHNKKVERQLIELEKKYFELTYLVRVYYPKYVKNSYQKFF